MCMTQIGMGQIGSLMEDDFNMNGDDSVQLLVVAHTVTNAQAIIMALLEEHFVSQLCSIAPANADAERQTRSSELQHNQQLDVPLSNDSLLTEGNDASSFDES